MRVNVFRAAAEAAAEAMGVTLAFEQAGLTVETNRGAIRRMLDIPGMIDPVVGWRKLLTELGLFT